MNAMDVSVGFLTCIDTSAVCMVQESPMNVIFVEKHLLELMHCVDTPYQRTSLEVVLESVKKLLPQFLPPSSCKVEIS